MHTTENPPSPASRARTDLPTNDEAVSRAISYVNARRPRFQVRARPSYLPPSPLPLLQVLSICGQETCMMRSRTHLPSYLSTYLSTTYLPI